MLDYISKGKVRLRFKIPNLFASSQINEIKFSGELLLVLQVLLLDVDQEDRVAARAVLIHVCK